jgi:hypothetical protein
VRAQGGPFSAAAATPSCGHDCIDIFSRQFGFHDTPNYVLDVLRQGAKVGQPIPDRPAAAAAAHPEPDRLLARLRQPDRLGSGQPALGR